MPVIHDDYRDRIRYLGKNVYLVCGSVFYFEPGTMDLSDPATAGNLISVSRELRTEGTVMHSLCGIDDVCCVYLSADGDRTITEGACIDGLPPDSREVARKAREAK